MKYTALKKVNQTSYKVLLFAFSKLFAFALLLPIFVDKLHFTNFNNSTVKLLNVIFNELQQNSLYAVCFYVPQIPLY